MMYQKEQETSDFILHIGDIAYCKGIQRCWDQFFQQVQPIAANMPYMVIDIQIQIYIYFSNNSQQIDRQISLLFHRKRELLNCSLIIISYPHNKVCFGNHDVDPEPFGFTNRFFMPGPTTSNYQVIQEIYIFQTLNTKSYNIISTHSIFPSFFLSTIITGQRLFLFV